MNREASNRNETCLRKQALHRIGQAKHVLLILTMAMITSLTLIGCGDAYNNIKSKFVSSADQEDGGKTEQGNGDEPYLPCEDYEDDPNEYGYCLYKYSGGLKTIAEIDEFCPKAGTWEQECRHAWVSGRMQPNSGFETDDLLKACGGNPDCTFELIDFRPNPDILVQIDYCAKYVRKHLRDCVGHAMQRWWYAQPDEEELKRVLKKPAPVPDRVGYYAAAVVECSGKGSCAGETTLMNICNKNARYFKQNPEKCPRREELKMNTNFKPSDYTPKVGSGKYRKPPASVAEEQRRGGQGGLKPGQSPAGSYRQKNNGGVIPPTPGQR